MRFRSVLLACGAVVVGSVTWLACISEDPGPLPSLGEDGGGCHNGGCLTGLQCVDGRCGPPTDAGSSSEASAPGDGGLDGSADCGAPPWEGGAVRATELRCATGTPCDRADGGVCCGEACAPEAGACAADRLSFCETATQCVGTGQRCCYPNVPLPVSQCPAFEDPSFDGTRCTASCGSGVELCRLGDPKACDGGAADGGCVAAKLGSRTFGICKR